MGVSRSGAELAGKLNRLPEQLARARTVALKSAGAKAKPVMMRAPGAASKVGGKTITVRDRMIGADALSLKWGPPGWVRILNDQTQPHFIARRGGGSLRRQNLSSGFGRKSARAGRLLIGQLSGAGGSGVTRGAIGLPGIGPRAYARHPGTKGKHFVEKSKRLARPVVVTEYAQKQVTEPLRQVFRG